MKETLAPAETAALKKDILSSLHCALPGTVESFDPRTLTAAVRPAPLKGLPLPLIRDVPVFFPGNRDRALTFPVSPGDGCLLVFADADVDRWLETGGAEEPASGRTHDLSDAFAFVGFRSRPEAPGDMPGEPSFFGLTASGLEEKLAGRAEAEHRHDAGDLVSGTLAVNRGGTGQAGTSASTVIANVAVAAPGCTLTTTQFAYWGKVAMLRLVVRKTAAVSSGTTTLATIVEGRRPRYYAMAERGWGEGARITPAGEVQVNGAIAANESITILSTYVVA